VPLNGKTSLWAKSGVFGVVGRGYTMSTHYLGETFSLEGVKITVRSLSSSEATLYFPERDLEVKLPLSAIGVLRAQVDSQKKELWHLKLRYWEKNDEQENAALLVKGFIHLFLSYVLIYGCILVGVLFWDDDVFYARLKNPKRFIRK
jgi:hypothetical protein